MLKFESLLLTKPNLIL